MAESPTGVFPFPLDDEPREDGGLGNDGGRKCGGGGQDVNDREKSTMNLESHE